MKGKAQNHPLTGTVQQFIKQKGLLQPGQKVIAAVSGGIDSMVMLNVLGQLQHLWKLEIVVAHVNFQLRGKESDKDEQCVKQTSERYGFPFYSQHTDTGAIAKNLHRSIQETARDIRYSFFDTLKKSLKADAIATAHTANDNAETVLINLLRGSGISGMAGIPPQRDCIIRPLLSVTRKEIEQYAKAMDLEFRTDSSNKEEKYTRNFLRKSIIPQLEKRINPSLTETLMNEAELFRQTAECIEISVDGAFAGSVSGSMVDCTALSHYHRFIQRSVIHRLLKELGIEPAFSTINAVGELMQMQKGTIIDINKQWVAERNADKIDIRTKKPQSTFLYIMEKEGELSTENFTITVKKSEPPDNKRLHSASIEYVDAAKVKFPLTIRSWKPGDAFHPLGMNGTKKLSDFFGEQKLTQEEKNSIPIIESGGTIVWVAGKRLNEQCKLTDTTTTVYQLTVQYRQFNGKKDDHR